MVVARFTHSHLDAPFLLAGSAGGALDTGRRIDYTGPSPTYHNNLPVSVLPAMGIETDTFGDSAYCTGALPGLTS